MSNSRFTEGLFFGAIIGAIVALLFAPQPGEKTRKYLKKLKEDNQDLIDETAETAEEAISKTLHAVHSGMDKIQEMLEDRNKERKNGKKQTSLEQDEPSRKTGTSKAKEA